ncbi:IclR family transcriptional regulator [Streptomyces sp. B1866]|uniref:IclR family transcriptional regulator n=1 Tax=Streptomyces sp. B1866 TaxID=3075431 RepID=UPI00288DCCEE|nr:IclR family transcriptional regulator [Streptomyces sp. B1866]MDT3396576.1 IclR family transcriptional regulator [Streptomyces sp. B1866]
MAESKVVPVEETAARPAAGRGVLEGAFTLLEAVKRTGEAGLTTLSATSGLPKTTTHRLLEQLVALGALERSGSNYRMGPRVFRLGQDWAPHPALLRAARGPVRHLARTTGASVGLCVLREGQTLAVAGIPGEVNELVPLRPGATWPWVTAAGKAIVAHMSPDLPLDPQPAAWRREADAIRDLGAALDRQELVEGVACVAVPLFGPRGVVASLSVLVDPARPLRRVTEQLVPIGKAVTAALRGW